ncbi:MAG TPA: type II toxin-antitoxin system VapC family toxin [Bryobacteraceae bacterium]|jgi:predicted nucleic-acid-binding protein
MRAFDTNILVRYVVNDDPKQAALVEKLWVECETNQEAIFIPILVLCELMWVLSRLYAQTKPQLIEVLEKLLAVGFFRFEQESAVRQSVEQYRRGKATFPDYMIGEISRQAGCRDTVTFDRDLRAAPGFTIL